MFQVCWSVFLESPPKTNTTNHLCGDLSIHHNRVRNKSPTKQIHTNPRYLAPFIDHLSEFFCRIMLKQLRFLWLRLRTALSGLLCMLGCPWYLVNGL